jgi:hypothetical protein
VFPSEVLPEVILSGPILGFILALVHVAAIDCHVPCTQLMHTPLMSVKVVVGAESLGSFRAVWDVALERLVVPCLVFPERSV